MQSSSGHLAGFKLAKLERGGSIHAASRQCLEPLPSALQIFNDQLITPMEAGATRGLTVPRCLDRMQWGSVQSRYA